MTKKTTSATPKPPKSAETYPSTGFPTPKPTRSTIPRAKPRRRILPHIAFSVALELDKTGRIKLVDLDDAINLIHNAQCEMLKYLPKLAVPYSIRLEHKLAARKIILHVVWPGPLAKASFLAKRLPGFRQCTPDEAFM